MAKLADVVFRTSETREVTETSFRVSLQFIVTLMSESNGR